MPLDTLDAYRKFADYKADLKTWITKSKASAQPFRLLTDFQTDAGKKPILMLGKLSGPLLTELKSPSGFKVKAQGLCKHDKDTLEFEVEKGSLVVKDAETALSAAGSSTTPAVVDKLGGGASDKSREIDLKDLDVRLRGLVARMEKVRETAPPQAIQSLQKLLLKLKGARGEAEVDDTVQELLSQFEQGLVAIERHAAIAKSKALQEDEEALKRGGEDVEVMKQRAGRLEEANKQVKEGASKNLPQTDGRGELDIGEIEEALAKIDQGAKTAVGKAEAYARDPNGFLLLGKLVNSSGTALGLLLKRMPKLEGRQKEAIEKTVNEIQGNLDKLAKLGERLKPGSMKEYMEQRASHLGYDIGNKKQVEQEGRIGGDIEMALGGLKRSPDPKVEFTPGDFSPYGKGDSKDAPHQMDVFGPEAAIIKKMVVLMGKKTYPKLEPVEGELLFETLVELKPDGDVQLPPMAEPMNVEGQKIWDAYLKQSKFFDSLEHHFDKGKNKKDPNDKRPTIVPFDSSGLAQWPAMLAYVKDEIGKRFPDKLHLIMWQDK